MGDDELKFQQRWDFRRRENEFESSSNDSKSSNERVLKKHKLVSSLILHDKEERSDSSRLQQKGSPDPGIGGEIKSGEAKRVQKRKGKKNNLANNEMKRASNKGTSRKKIKTYLYEPAALEDLKSFMESLLEDLQVTRETLFMQMREEMQKLVENDTDVSLKKRESSSGRGSIQLQPLNNPGKDIQVVRHNNLENMRVQHQTKLEENDGVQCQNKSTGKDKVEKVALSVKSGSQSRPSHQNVQVRHPNNVLVDVKAQNCNGGSSARSVKGKKKADSINHCQVPKEQVDCCPAIVSMKATEKDERERLGLSAEPNFSSNHSIEIASSMYLTLPTVLSEPHVMNLRLDTSSGNYIQPRPVRDKTGVNSERSNPLPYSSNYHGYLSHIKPEERNGNFIQMGSGDVDYFNQKSAPTSSIGTGFSVPLHQSMTAGGFNTPIPVGLDNLPQENSNLPGLRMDGAAMRFSAGNYALLDRYVANNFHNLPNYKSFPIPDLKEGHVFPK